MKAILKYFAASNTATRIARSLARGPILIINYHDITEEDEVPRSWLRVPLAAFDQQIGHLGQIADFVTPDQVLTAAPDSRLRVLLTFDDGYVNHFRLVFPLLQRYQIPALFFVSTWHMRTLEPFWFDRIAIPVQTGGLRQLDLRDLHLGLFRFRGDNDAHRWDDIQRLLLAVKAVGNAGHPVVESILNRLADPTAPANRAAFADCRPLAVEEMVAMFASRVCHFGSHGHRHEILTRLPHDQLEENLLCSREFLAGALRVPIADIAYPNGDHDAGVLAVAEGHGFTRGYTVCNGLVRAGSTPLALPRLQVGGFDSTDTLLMKINSLLLRSSLALGK